ncbi:MAG: carbon-nitrogen hydrolase family protein [Anaerolineales bacterium]|nr:carbon-nitrogen hydrolase family protein [Anaerolineales bacterium]
MTTTNTPTDKPRTDLTRLAAGIGVSLLTSILLILAFHPHNLWLLAFFALVPAQIAQYRILPQKWAGLGSAVGIGGWLFVFLGGMFAGSPAGMVIQIVVAVIIVIQIFTVPGVRRFHERTGYRWFVLQGVFDWVGIEMIRSFIPPINTHAFIAQTMYTQPWMLQPISIFSIYGLGVVIILVNFALTQGAIYLLEKKWRLEELPFLPPKTILRWLGAAAGVLAIWVGASLLILASAPANAPVIRAAAIQHNYPVPGHQDSAESQPLRLQALSEQARLAAQQGAQLIVMPELGLGFDPQVEYTAELKALAAETNAYLLIGYGLDDPRGWRNEAVMLTPEGEFLQVYGKNHATSPGEPPILTAGVYPVYDTSLGRLATIICNDVHWTDTSRRLARDGAQLISVPTLEIPGIALEQVAQSVLRAVENRVAVVKTDVAYAAAIIDPYGRIIALRDGSPDGAAFALTADVPLGTSAAPYTRLGDWVGWLCLAGFVFFTGFQEVSKRQGKATRDNSGT